MSSGAASAHTRSFVGRNRDRPRYAQTRRPRNGPCAVSSEGRPKPPSISADETPWKDETRTAQKCFANPECPLVASPPGWLLRLNTIADNGCSAATVTGTLEWELIDSSGTEMWHTTPLYAVSAKKAAVGVLSLDSLQSRRDREMGTCALHSPLGGRSNRRDPLRSGYPAAARRSHSGLAGLVGQSNSASIAVRKRSASSIARCASSAGADQAS
jgi:hypothetical protein